MKTILRIFCLITLFSNPVYAEEVERKAHKTLDSKSNIKNLDTALKKAEEALGFSVLFPTFVPDDQANFPTMFSSDDRVEYYAYLFVSPSIKETEVRIEIDATEDCHGVKVCTHGGLTVKKEGVPEMRKDISGKPITEEVTLKDNIKGYYTPGHAMADYWPAEIQWIYKDVLYRLGWKNGDREDLIKMANSAIREPNPHQAAH